MKPIQKVFAFVEDRTGLGGLLRQTFDEQIYGGARIGHVFGTALWALFLVQCVTGIVLAMTYAPTPAGAWSSVFFIQEMVVNGWFVRGVHSYAAEAMLVVLGLHLLQLIAYGAYRRPHEVSWWLTLGLGGLVLASLLTGFRLPWDQHSYWALQVEMNVAAATPVVGQEIYELVVGGPTLGQSTLTRLYAIHALVLPPLFIAVFMALRGQRRKHGWVLPPWSQREKVGTRLGQLGWDSLFIVLVLAVVVFLTVDTGGRYLYSPAEPDRDFPARPEWFLLPLFKARMLLPASLEMVATMVMPALIAGFLLMLPFLDRKPTDRVVRRIVWLVPVLVIFAVLGGLTVMSQADDRADPDHQEAVALAQERAQRAVELARSGIPPEGPVAMLNADPMTRGAEVYQQYCSSCHVLDGKGERRAPDHTGFGSRAWIRMLLEEPQDGHFFKYAGMSEDMTSQRSLGDEVLTQVVEYLFSHGVEPQDEGSIDSAAAYAGAEVVAARCTRCHTFRGEEDVMGIGAPELAGWGTRTWIYRQIADPDATYGTLNEMPAFADQLSEHDIRMVTAYLRRQRFATPDFTVPSDDTQPPADPEAATP